MKDSFDVVVAGSGLAGTAAALALAQAGFDTAIVSPRAMKIDGRTTALLASSVAFLESLGVWDGVAASASPLATIRIIDATGRLLRAPEMAFHASEIGLAAFGYNAANEELLTRMTQAGAATGRLTRMEASVENAAFSPGGQSITLDSGATLSAGLVVGADGRNSAVRRLAAIGAREWSYPQTALVLEFGHTLSHHDTSTEFHTPEGPFTFVPLAADRCGLVWVLRPEKAQDRLNWRKDELESAIERQMHSMLGKITIVSEVQAWKLSGLVAHAFGKPGMVLAGEAAHVFPPIGAQGFNLGIRDVELIAKLAREAGRERLGAIGPRYHRQRMADISSRIFAVDLLNRSLLSQFLPVQMARALAMHAISSVGPLRRLLMREGVAHGGHLKSLTALLPTGR